MATFDDLARASIKAYEGQIAKAEAILNEDRHILAIVALPISDGRAAFADGRSLRDVTGQQFEFDEDVIIEALQAFVKDREESIRILAEGLAPEAEDKAAS